MQRFGMMLVGLALGLAACADDSSGAGRLELTLWGEAFIEEEIPAASGAESEGFVDGWSLRFSRFLVAVGEVRVEDHDGTVAIDEPVVRIYDLHQPGPHLMAAFEEVGAQRWPLFSFVIAPPSVEAEPGNATADDMALMVDNGFSVYVEGEASSGEGETYSFAWGFDRATRYHDCHHHDDFGEGVVVPNGGVESAEITIHGDHLFYDDLQSPDTVLRFDALAAADADGDRVITLEELELVDLTTLTEGTYGTGGVGTVEDLRAFVTALTRTLGHWRGEGHCGSTILD